MDADRVPVPRAEHPVELPGQPTVVVQRAGLEIVLDTTVEAFAQRVMSQHDFFVYGDATAEVAGLCGLLGIEVLR